MNVFRKLQTITLVSLSLFLFVPQSFAAAPDGLGPWADSVFSFHQGLMKNGLPVPAARSDTTAAVGVAENTPTVDTTFFSLGFGGNIVLGFDNGISTGAMVVEATIEPGYPIETARVEMSQDGVNWVMSGNVEQSGTVNKPAQIACAKYVRITDTSDPAIMPDAIADGYDVDGVRATGDLCEPNPTVTPTATPSATLTVTLTPTQSPTQPPSNSSSGSSSNSSGSSGSSSSSNSSSGSSSNSSSNPTATPTPLIVRTTSSSPCPTIGNPLIPCFPNTGSLSPRLPNTGIDPDNNMFERIQMGIAYIFSMFSNVLSGKQ